MKNAGVVTGKFPFSEVVGSGGFVRGPSLAVRVAVAWFLTWAAAAAFGELRFGGLCYSPFRDGQSPASGVEPTAGQIRDDLTKMRQWAPAVRTYGMAGTLAGIPKLAKEAGLRCLAGAWLDGVEAADEAELRRLQVVAAKRQAAGVVVGNEVLLRGTLSPAELIAAIRRVRAVSKVPVGYADTWGQWLAHPELVAECDFVLCHVHPYWDGVAVEQAVDHVVARWSQVAAAFPGKRVVVGETGWPTAGETRGAAVPGEANQGRFVRELATRALHEGMTYYLFAAFDENWKSAPGFEVEAHWGIGTTGRVLKPEVAALVGGPPAAIEITTPARRGAGPNSRGTMAGVVYGVAKEDLADYRVVVYAGTDHWYVQPTVAKPWTKLGKDGTWRMRTHLGHRYAALLVRTGMQAPAVTDGLPVHSGDVVAWCVAEPSGD